MAVDRLLSAIQERAAARGMTLAALARAGVEIGSHGALHRDLTTCADADLDAAAADELIRAVGPVFDLRGLRAGQAYTIEGHFLNASAKTVQASAELVLVPKPAGSSVQQADMLFLSATTQLGKKYDGISPGLPPAVGMVPTATTIDPALTDDYLEMTFELRRAGVPTEMYLGAEKGRGKSVRRA